MTEYDVEGNEMFCVVGKLLSKVEAISQTGSEKKFWKTEFNQKGMQYPVKFNFFNSEMVDPLEIGLTYMIKGVVRKGFKNPTSVEVVDDTTILPEGKPISQDEIDRHDGVSNSNALSIKVLITDPDAMEVVYNDFSSGHDVRFTQSHLLNLNIEGCKPSLVLVVYYKA